MGVERQRAGEGHGEPHRALGRVGVYDEFSVSAMSLWSPGGLGQDKDRKPKGEGAADVQERSDDGPGQGRGRRGRQRTQPSLPSMTSAPSSAPEPRPSTWRRHGPGEGTDGHTDVTEPEGCSCHSGIWPLLPACRLGPEELIQKGWGPREPGTGRAEASPSQLARPRLKPSV